jgi:hypothetical protein
MDIYYVYLGFVLGSAGGSSSLVASLATVVEVVENWINTTVANGVRWGI